VTVVSRVLTHGRNPETVMEGLTADSDGLEKSGYFLGTVLGGGLVVVRGVACQCGSRGGILSRIVPGEIGGADVYGRVCHCGESGYGLSENCSGGDCGLNCLW